MSFEETLPNSEQKYAATIIETAYFLGIGIGSLTLSWYSNNFGRKPALLICQGILAFGLLGSNFASTTDVYAAFCFIIGLGFGGAEFACFVLLSEFVDVQNRNTYLGLMQTMWGLSIISISLLYWVDASWRFLTIVFLILAVSVFFSTLFTDESVRFLCSVRSNFPEARRILDKVALVNNTTPFQGTLEGELCQALEPAIQPTDSDGYSIGPQPAPAKSVQGPKMYGYIVLCKYASVRNLFIITCIDFFSMAFVYYVVTLSLPFYLNNPVTNGLVMGSFELVAVFCAIPMIGKFGRKWTLIFTYYMTLVTGAFAIGFHESSEGCEFCHILETISLGLLKFALSANFCAMAILITEIFPTVIRDIAFGASSFSARISSGLSPFVILLFRQMSLNPLISILGCALLASTISWWLPETLNQPMPDYIKEEREMELQERDTRSYANFRNGFTPAQSS